jgi:pimeloyl-ACP methyl ester carboxylesterase
MNRLGRPLAITAPIAAPLFALFLVASAGLTRVLVRRAERRYPRPAGAVVVDGVELRYTQAGSGRPVVLIHGLLGSTYDFEVALTGVLATRYRVVAFDRPGNGYSEAPPTAGRTPIGQAYLLHEAVNRLGLERPILVGYSLGAAVAVAYAELFPGDVAAVVTVGGHVLPCRLPAARLVGALRLPILGRLAGATLLVPAAYPLGYELLRRACSPQRLPAAYARSALAVGLRPGPFRRAVEDLERASHDLHVLAWSYGTLEVPFVVLVGSHDRIAPAAESQAFHRRLRESLLTVVGDGGHALHVTHPATVAAAIEAAWTMAERKAQAAAEVAAEAAAEAPTGEAASELSA